MAGKNFAFYDDVAGLERYLNFSEGTLRQIPIYARVPAVDAILRVKEMEASNLFRPGLYYIVLADLVGNTAFNVKYGNAEGDIRTEWFHTCAIQALGELEIENYVAFNKTIGDASLFVFSSFKDVYRWSGKLDDKLDAITPEYSESLQIRGVEFDEETLEERMADFAIKARRLVHLGEISYKDRTDPLCLAVSQTFKVEKEFAATHLGCTKAVADAVRPTLNELGARLVENKAIRIAGAEEACMSYYVVPR